jgi:hypothetical protein
MRLELAVERRRRAKTIRKLATAPVRDGPMRQRRRFKYAFSS